MILDELVLDVNDYMDNHPGGRFLLEHNIGRDISKFYYGGYALDNNHIHRGTKAHAHSNIAASAVTTMIVARLIPTPSILSGSH